jgi:HEAT repeat protein
MASSNNKRVAFAAGSNGPPWGERLRFAARDATCVAEALKAHCDFDVFNHEDLNDGVHEDLNDGVFQKVRHLAAECKPGDELIVYFSGHGTLYAGRLFLLWDDTSESIFDSALNVHHIIEYMSLSQATNKLLVLDCCHAGRAVGFKGDLGPTLKGDSGSQLVLCASSHLEQACELDELGASFLTHHICGLLASPSKSSITLRELENELRGRANDWNKIRPQHRVPVPFLFGTERSPFIIKRGATQPVPAPNEHAVTLSREQILLSYVGSEVVEDRRFAMDELRKLGSPAYMSVFLDALADSDPIVQDKAAEALAEMGTMAIGVIPKLIDTVSTGTERTATKAMEVLGNLGPVPAEAAPTLIKFLQSRCNPANHGDSPSAGPATTIFDMITGRNQTEASAAAITALGQIGPKASEAVPLLVRIVEDVEKSLNSGADKGWFVDAVQAVQGFFGGGEHAHLNGIRKAAIVALGKIGARDNVMAVSLIERLTSDEDEEIRLAAAEAITQLRSRR